MTWLTKTFKERRWRGKRRSGKRGTDASIRTGRKTRLGQDDRRGQRNYDLRMNASRIRVKLIKFNVGENFASTKTKDKRAVNWTCQKTADSEGVSHQTIINWELRTQRYQAQGGRTTERMLAGCVCSYFRWWPRCDIVIYLNMNKPANFQLLNPHSWQYNGNALF